MKFKAIRTLRGDYGPNGTTRQVQPGEVFEVPDYRVRSMRNLEANGLVCRHTERAKVERLAYTVYENKAVAPEENKQPKRERRGR